MELVSIGKVLKTHGFKGHLKVFIDPFYMEDFEAMKALFIEQLPYFIRTKQISSDEQAIILLEDIDTKEKAHPLQGKAIFAQEDDLSEIIEEEVYKDLEGFLAEDQHIGKLGKIEQVLEMPQQFLAQLYLESAGKRKEILIPLHDDLIVKIDEQKKTILFNLPDGFLSVF